MLPSKNINFQGPYLRQNWSFPDSFIYNLAIKPSNANGFAKLVKCCKYFCSKNPVLVITRLILFSNNRWVVFGKEFENKEWLEIKNLTGKLWITHAIESNYRFIFFVQVYPKFYKTDYKKLDLYHQTISYNDFLFISSNVETIVLNDIIVNNNGGTIVPLEKLVKVLPKIKYITFVDNSVKPISFTSNTVKEHLIIPHFSKISEIDLLNIPKTFDIETCFAFIKKNKRIKCSFLFHESISVAYKTGLEAIIDEILQTENHDYKVPDIFFWGCNQKKWDKLQSLLNKN